MPRNAAPIAQAADAAPRPDQYVAHILPLDAHDTLAGFFDDFMLPAA